MSDSIEKMARECLETVDRIIADHGPRMAGSGADGKTARILAAKLGEYADSSGVDSFDAHPAVFFSYMKLLPVVYLAGLAAPFLPRVFSGPVAALLVLGIAMMVVIFGLYSHGFDRFFPRARCANVWGVLEPSGPVRRQVILSGHHDSACIARLLQGPLHNLAGILLMLPYLFFAFETVILAARFSFGIDIGGWEFRVFLAGIPFAVGYFFAINPFRGGPGAGDNLVSSVMAIRLGRYLADHRDEMPKDTRVWIVSFDAEEAGLRGSAEFFRSRRNEFLAIPTTHLNFDSLYSESELHCIVRDINGTVGLDPDLSAEIIGAGRDCGLDIKPFAMTFPYGGTDAAESARIGLRSVTVVGMPTGLIQEIYVYHTKRDTVDRIEPGVVEACMKLVLRHFKD